MEKRIYWRRARFMPAEPLEGHDRPVTGSEEFRQLARKAAEEAMVLAKNDGTLPFKKGQKLAVFGLGQVDYVRHVTGAANIHNTPSVTLLEGLLDREKTGDLTLFRPLSARYCAYFEAHRDPERTFDPIPEIEDESGLPALTEPEGPLFEPVMWENMDIFARNGAQDGIMMEPFVPAALYDAAEAFTDTALITISRTAGEFYDRSVSKGDFLLSDGEKALIAEVEKRFAHVAVTLNIPAAIEAGWLEDEKIGAVLFMWHPGQEGGHAAADILCGLANPSAKMADTVARNYEDYPSAESFLESPWYVNYEEDIFVGYRYFETVPGAKEKVVYPFGHGLSYTTFGYEAEGETDGESVTVRVKVTNTGSVSGKEAVDVYYGAPAGRLEKPARQLAAFGKTKELAPGESEVLTISWPVSRMASYDETGVIEKSCKVLEAGDYPVYAGGSVRNAACVFVYHQEETKVTERLTAVLPPVCLPRKMKADGSFEAVPFRAPVPPHYPEYKALPKYPLCPPIQLSDVLEGKATMDEMISQMSNQELATLTGGMPAGGVCSTSGFAGLAKYGIPVAPTSDAPGGLRVIKTSGVKGTSFPTATGLACSRNEAMTEEIGRAIASEIKENNMLAWLGPALNIHRNPLSGRNGEYYSEDPVVAGKMAAASVRGAQSMRISASPKHFACNNKEFIRRESDSRLTERALREIYLKGFEICVKESDPKTIMTSYNLINGVWAVQSEDLITTVLRGEWGFRGMVMTDWCGHGLHMKEVMAGSDMKMPRGDIEQLLRGCRERQGGEICRAALEARVRNLLNLLLWYEGNDTWL